MPELIFRKGLPIFFFLFLLGTPARSMEARGELEGRPVKAVRFAGDAPPPDEGTILIPLEPGEPYSWKEVTEGVRRLFKTGKFGYIRVEVEEEEGGLVVIFFLEPPVLVEKVSFEGRKNVSLKTLRKASLLKAGGLFFEEEIEKSLSSILSEYRSRGFFDTEVKAEVIPLPHHKVHLIYRISEKRPILVSSVQIAGDTFFTPSRIKGLLKTEKGERLSSSMLRKDKERLEAFYRKKGFLEARVKEPAILVEESRKEAEVTFLVNAGERIRFAFRGGGIFSRRWKKMVTGEEEFIYTKAHLEDLAGGITKALEEKGYFSPNTEVHVSHDKKRREKRITFQIHRGEKVRLRHMEFSGNEAFSSRVLEAVMEEGSPGIMGKRLFTEKAFERALIILRDFYRGNGFLSAEVIKKEARWLPGRESVDLVIAVSEGKQTVISEILFSGNDSISEAELSSTCLLKKGFPLNPALVDDAAGAIERYYRQKGFLNAAVSGETLLLGAGEKGRVRFSISEGPLFTFGTATLRGNRKTKDSLVMKKMALVPGEAYSEDSKTKTTRNIAETGLFRAVRVVPVPGMGTVKDVVVEVEEKPSVTLEGGGAVSSDDGIKVFMEGTYNNLFGTGKKVSLAGQVGQPWVETGLFDFYLSDDLGDLTWKMLLTYNDPFFLGSDAQLTSTTLLHEEQKRRTYSLLRSAVSAGLSQDLTPFLKSYLQYQAEWRDPFDVVARAALAPEDEEGNPCCTADIDERWFGIITVIFLHDRRDDRFNPKKGIFSSVEVNTTDGLFSQENFFELLGHSTLYFPLPLGMVIQGTLTAGYTIPFGGTSEIPIDKRFYLGGSTSVRGFLPDSLGPVNRVPKAMYDITGGMKWVPTGGDALLSYSTELRIPLPFLPDLSLALFSDGGNVFLTNTSFPPDDRGDSPFLRTSAGMGVRYRTPLGQLGLDMGINLAPKRDEPAILPHLFLETF